MTDDFPNIDKQDEFLNFYPEWINSSKLNRISGLESFPYRFVSLGCTQALDEFHFWCYTQGKRIRLFRGEYPYNRDCIPFNWKKDFIDDHSLKKDDAVIISLPFSGSGSIHPRWEELLQTCDKLKVPVLVDCAFFGTCAGIEVDFDHPAIQSVVFSTTKGLSCGNYRNGIQFSKRNSGSLATQSEWHHGIHLNVSLGLELMKNFSPDFLYDKYHESYKEVCQYFKLQETNCIHLAIGDKSWQYFSRDGAYNRVGVKKAVKDAFKASKKQKTYQPNL